MSSDHEPRETPTTLFRFFDHHGLQLLTHGTLKVTPPREFNDPLEFWPALRKRPYAEAEIRGHLLESKILRGAFDLRHPNTTDEEYLSHVKQYVPLYVNDPSAFHDELAQERDIFRNNLSRGFGVVCFSAFEEEELSSPTGVRHWAAYAANHTGMAIEFDTSHPWFQTRFALGESAFMKVRYDLERPDCNLRDLRTMENGDLARILATWGKVKSRAWKDEAEWRCIVPFAEQPFYSTSTVQHGERLIHLVRLIGDPGLFGKRVADHTIIKRVILGCRASPNLEESVRTICVSLMIPVSRMREHPGEFKLDVIELTKPTR